MLLLKFLLGCVRICDQMKCCLEHSKRFRVYYKLKSYTKQYANVTVQLYVSEPQSGILGENFVKFESLQILVEPRSHLSL